jgi:hypothetical protein
LPCRESAEVYKDRDDLKLKKCEELGIRLVYVPYWWDNTETSLANVIHEATNDTLRGILRL